MEKFKHLQKIKELYDNNENIIQYLKRIGKNDVNSIEDILISYDFQSGSYIKHLSRNKELIENYCKAITKVFDQLSKIHSIIEIGVGEATTLNTVLQNSKKRLDIIMGMDISWSRLKFAKELLNDFNIAGVRLFRGNLFQIPLMDNSVELVYTSHSIEPNGGKEEEALRELYRITQKYLVLIEPSFELANAQAKSRMIEHGYVTKLLSTALRLGYKIIEHRLFEYSINPLNPTGLIIIEKNQGKSNSSSLVCPITHTKLTPVNKSLLYSKQSFLAYPVIEEIPCLLTENAILAAHLLTDYKKYKIKHNIVLDCA